MLRPGQTLIPCRQQTEKNAVALVGCSDTSRPLISSGCSAPPLSSVALCGLGHLFGIFRTKRLACNSINILILAVAHIPNA